jgi:hypothetical protein
LAGAAVYLHAVYLHAVYLRAVYLRISFDPIVIVDVDADFWIDRGRGWISNVHYG